MFKYERYMFVIAASTNRIGRVVCLRLSLFRRVEVSVAWGDPWWPLRSGGALAACALSSILRPARDAAQGVCPYARGIPGA